MGGAFWTWHGVLPRTNPLWSSSPVSPLMAVAPRLHTAALAGSATMYRDLFRQAGLVQACLRALSEYHPCSPRKCHACGSLPLVSRRWVARGA